MIVTVKHNKNVVAFVDLVEPIPDKDMLEIDFQLCFASIYRKEFRDFEIVFNKRDK